MSTQTLDTPTRTDYGKPKIAHLTYPHSPWRALCGVKISGIEAPEGYLDCVVCTDLALGIERGSS